MDVVYLPHLSFCIQGVFKDAHIFSLNRVLKRVQKQAVKQKKLSVHFKYMGLRQDLGASSSKRHFELTRSKCTVVL